MKTKNLYPRVYVFENLHLVFRAARRGKRDRVASRSGHTPDNCSHL